MKRFARASSSATNIAAERWALSPPLLPNAREGHANEYARLEANITVTSITWGAGDPPNQENTELRPKPYLARCEAFAHSSGMFDPTCDARLCSCVFDTVSVCHSVASATSRLLSMRFTPRSVSPPLATDVGFVQNIHLRALLEGACTNERHILKLRAAWYSACAWIQSQAHVSKLVRW